MIHLSKKKIQFDEIDGNEMGYAKRSKPINTIYLRFTINNIIPQKSTNNSHPP